MYSSTPQGSKPLRDTSLSIPIAEGRSAQVFRWTRGTVLKLYREGWPLSLAKLEVKGARTARSCGLHVPAVRNFVEYSGRIGLVYDECEASSLLHTLAAKPWTLWGSAQMFARLHESIHARTTENLESQRARLERKIREGFGLRSREKAELLQRLYQLPEGENLCHGDFHPDNVLMGTDGPIIVDWADACRGNPWADVAQTSLLFRVSKLPPGTPNAWLVAVGRGLFHWLYLHYYAQNRNDERWQFSAWLPVVAAARLADGPAVERHGTLALIRRYLRGSERVRPTRFNRWLGSEN